MERSLPENRRAWLLIFIYDALLLLSAFEEMPSHLISLSLISLSLISLSPFYKFAAADSLRSQFPKYSFTLAFTLLPERETWVV